MSFTLPSTILTWKPLSGQVLLQLPAYVSSTYETVVSTLKVKLGSNFIEVDIPLSKDKRVTKYVNLPTNCLLYGLHIHQDKYLLVDYVDKNYNFAFEVPQPNEVHKISVLVGFGFKLLELTNDDDFYQLYQGYFTIMPRVAAQYKLHKEAGDLYLNLNLLRAKPDLIADLNLDIELASDEPAGLLVLPMVHNLAEITGDTTHNYYIYSGLYVELTTNTAYYYDWQEHRVQEVTFTETFKEQLSSSPAMLVLPISKLGRNDDIYLETFTKYGFLPDFTFKRLQAIQNYCDILQPYLKP